jgi:hypothetical protein
MNPTHPVRTTAPSPVTAGRAATPREAFDKMDADLIRVLEDLVFVLIDKGVITLAELPPHAQTKLLNRKGFRDRMHTHVSNAKNAEFSVTLDDSKFGLLR